MAIGKYAEWLTPEKLTLLEAWARDGLTDEQIAKNMGISESTLYAWKGKYPEFSDALKKGKEVVDIQVENALFKRAMGYKTVEVTEETRLIGVDDDKVPIYAMAESKRVYKEFPPDVTAQIFWLKNRKPKEWRDKQQIDTNICIGENDVVRIGYGDEV
jgi:transcriptional regulator with XRE-family HTH domain